MNTKNIIYNILACLVLTFTACEDEVNQWPVDESHDRLFSSLKMEADKVGATDITILYSKSPEATHYIFEFSEDSLKFENIVRTVRIEGDTLTQSNDATAVMKKEYKTVFDDLKGVTPYSVRMRSYDALTDRYSNYQGFYFETAREQIIESIIAGMDEVKIYWTAGKPLTHLMLSKQIDENIFDDGIRYDLTDAMIEAGNTTITGLENGTRYQVQLYDDEIVRGTNTFRTLGIQNGESIIVLPTDTISYILADCAARQVTDVSLVFTAGESYDSGEIKVPGGINNLMFVGVGTENGNLPQLLIPCVSLVEPMENITFTNVSIDGKNSDKNYMFSLGGGYSFKSILFEDCEVRHYNRSVLRINSTNLSLGEIKFNRCFINDIGKSGYGLLILSAQKEVQLISITECTMVDLGDQIMQTNEGVLSIIIDKSTFYNNTLGIPKIFRFDKQPAEVSVTNTIFSGPNAGKKVNSGNGDYSSYLSFGSCYITTDFVVDTRKFTGITEYAGTSDDLFVDPVNGDFHIKDGAKFEGKGVAGDPRWW